MVLLRTICAIDISADQIAAARERCAGMEWAECRVADALELPYEDGDFDKVFSIQVLDYIPALDDVVREICRVLRPGGRFVNLSNTGVPSFGIRTNRTACIKY